MISTIFSKIFGDFLNNKGKTILTITAIFISIIGMGALFFSYAILMREMDKNYMLTNPMSAGLTVTDLDQKALDRVAQMDEISVVEQSGYYKARFEWKKGQWKNAILFVIKDFSNIKLNRFYPESDSLVPETGEILLERSAMDFAGTSQGDQLNIILPGHSPVTLEITGVVHDPGEAPAYMENLIYGYISSATLHLLGEDGLNELSFIVKERNHDWAYVKSITQKAKNILQEKGYEIEKIVVPMPGRHPHATQMDSLLFLLLVFGIFSFVLGSILVVNLVSAIIGQQVRQIGIMKTLGASRWQISLIYLLMVLLMSVTALIPGTLLAKMLAEFVAESGATMLNFKIYDSTIPVTYYLLLSALGIFVPLLTSLFPVARGTKVTVKEALTDYGISRDISAKDESSIIKAFNYFSRPLVLSITNTFRKKARLILTMLTLIIGGALFMTALNMGTGIDKTIDEFVSIKKYDIEISLKNSVPEERIKQVLSSISGIEDYEIWRKTKGVLINKNGDESSSFPVYSVPHNTGFLKPKITQGQWLEPGDKNTAVLRHTFLYFYPETGFGDNMKLRINDQTRELEVRGISTLMGESLMYISPESFVQFAGSIGKGEHVVVKSIEGSDTAVVQLMNRLVLEFEKKGLVVSGSTYTGENRRVLEDHFFIIVSYLLFITILVLILGGLGLTNTMSMNVLERTREIGVMKAIGAGSGSIIGMILAEAFLLGIISWLISFALSLPVTFLTGQSFGYIFFRAPLSFAVNPWGALVWIAIIIFFSLIASLSPAVKAVRISVKDALAYE